MTPRRLLLVPQLVFALATPSHAGAPEWVRDVIDRADRCEVFSEHEVEVRGGWRLVRGTSGRGLTAEELIATKRLFADESIYSVPMDCEPTFRTAYRLIAGADSLWLRVAPLCGGYVTARSGANTWSHWVDETRLLDLHVSHFPGDSAAVERRDRDTTTWAPFRWSRTILKTEIPIPAAPASWDDWQLTTLLHANEFTRSGRAPDQSSSLQWLRDSLPTNTVDRKRRDEGDRTTSTGARLPFFIIDGVTKRLSSWVEACTRADSSVHAGAFELVSRHPLRLSDVAATWVENEHSLTRPAFPSPDGRYVAYPYAASVVGKGKWTTFAWDADTHVVLVDRASGTGGRILIQGPSGTHHDALWILDDLLVVVGLWSDHLGRVPTLSLVDLRHDVVYRYIARADLGNSPPVELRDYADRKLREAYGVGGKD